jgi:hypothetical protein
VTGDLQDLNHEKFLLLYTLPPFESDGPDDAQDWNLFDTYLDRNDGKEGLYERHSLSKLLQRWQHAMVLMSPFYPPHDSPLTSIFPSYPFPQKSLYLAKSTP